MAGNREELISDLARLGYALLRPREGSLTENRVFEILETLVKESRDPRLVEGFPVVLATCATQGPSLDLARLLERKKADPEVREDLEKMFFLSAHLLREEGLSVPGDLDAVAKDLEAKYGELAHAQSISLSSGVTLSTDRLVNALKRYAAGLRVAMETAEKEKDRQLRSFLLSAHLGALFSKRQKEIILKRLEGKPLTKTEREYYSRVVKKKLKALANRDLQKIASTLVGADKGVSFRGEARAHS